MTKLRIAVQGCCHGELNNVYRTVSRMNSNKKIDLLLILGDFQSLRSPADFDSISIPPKFRKLGDFHKYYNNEMSAPVPTIFIGGNHESMRHLMLLPYGGYAAKNIYYLGYSNVIWFKGVRIGSLSGIWKEWDVDKPRFEWDVLESQHWQRGIKSLYHVRQRELLPLYMLDDSRQRMDIMLSHDWPNEVVYYGDVERLLKTKPFFKKDINNKELGSPINSELLNRMSPKWWLSAHLHVKFTAEVNNDSNDENGQKPKSDSKNMDEINLDLDLDLDSDSDPDPDSVAEKKVSRTTSFLALDKCMPRRQWLEIIEVEADTTHASYINDAMYYDPEFIGNVQFIEKHKDILYTKKLQDFNWAQLRKEKNDESNGSDDIENYRIENYEKPIQKKEVLQTDSFRKRFLQTK
ncbi:similar to Saccharomyces cerevisiae YKL149C DBR1 RNA lariat debranching enzyme, involved in intron turnover [Maudiozyma barnettii]|uniref:Similar to Saccharomyces cerevisiae YKL149C DBR1 RNA lariat debranching enzyme, involved in intron turnover n=1 Tax=Maudiozyma barnettii TaxID=61262 RepID=A0A8H2ZGT1_9SACH|nr:RNA lariat debranching enzyme [Kazachstania barnettii]CAB4254934.1 similar to Saccharomyces cerevisiae YKL149C DBR1 RNA lariat debranching enzyme, involved in intron turnover [Kazachstania barnettii]CAD1783205.1 similar to Saccharomyces cerevisiae YKL149C DBR1 RNA lariat debranching enzyme, involved in intron turnover [Kazachstania barnettii]